ncbi:MEDS domain-containing protein [Natrinema salifodinae]|uniref:histidine kinase n=3 Tax=Natrinema salifodinae TaxID=1202768 RepID=A0A1I0PTA8_9EURY|nr:MEDS domain-containing protein [Natrinema salifodinae]SEW17568.1 GAF domain-containing protein [Natrinema salifodinae]
MSDMRQDSGIEEAVIEGEFGPREERSGDPHLPSGSGPVESPGGHEEPDHFALIYERRAEQFATVVPYVRQGLERGEHCLYIYAENTRADVLEALRSSGVDVDAALDDGRLSLRSVEETYLEGGEFDVDEAYGLLEAAMEKGQSEYEGFRVTAEETWLVRDEATQEAFMTCEARVNELFDGEAGMALCQYNRDRLPPSVIEDVIETHPYLIYDDTVCHNVYYTPPAEFFGPDRPACDNERKLQTLVDRTSARTTLRTDEWAQRKLYAIVSDPHRTFEEKVDDLLAFGRELFGLEVGGIARVDPATDLYRIEAISGDHEQLEPGTEIPLSDTYCREVIEDDPTVPKPTEFSAATGGLPETPGDDRAQDVRVYLGTCIPIEGDLDRTFFFTSSDPSDGAVSEKEQAFLQLMGEWVKYELERRHHERLLRDLYETIADPEASFDAKLERLLELGSERFGLEIGYFTQTDDGAFEVVAAVGDHDKIRAGVTDSIRNTYCEKLLASPDPISVTDAAEVGWTDDHAYERFGLDAYFATTVHVGGEEYGTLCFGSESPRKLPFSDAERTFLDLMGQWVSHELDQRRRRRSLQKSYEITSDPGLSFEEKLERLLEVGRERFGLEMGGLNHLPTWDGAFRLEKGIGLDVDPDDELWTDPGMGCFCRQAITADAPVDTTDASETDWADDEVFREFGLTTYLGTKVASGSGPYGTLWFGSTESRDRPFSDAERTFIELMGQWVGYEIERREHRRSQERLYEITADSDRTFDEKVERLLDLGREWFDLDMGFFLEKQGDEFRVVKTRGTDLEEGVATLCANSGNYCKQTITVDVPVGVEDTKAIGWDDDPLYEEYGLGCYLGTRVLDGDGVYGSVCFADSTARQREFSDAEYAFLDLIGQWLSYELERDERERRLERSNERLEESNKRLEQFAYAASHDLQEPLRMVSSYLQLLERRYGDDLDGDGEEFLEFAVDGADRMREMIDGLLQYSRVETRGEPLEPVDLDDVFESVREDLRVQIEETDAEITADPLPPVRGDASQLRQVFQNLLSNAIKYSGDEPPRIHVSAERRSRGRTRVISVEDEGIGIEPDEQERIFDIFDRLHSREEYDGTGIGLALCERIVERHDGEIWVDAESGEGSTFSFTLQPPAEGES